MGASQLSRVTESEALLKSARNRIVVVHYACSDFYKVPIEINCIVAKEFVTRKTMSFSRAGGAPEKELLSKFYAYVQKDPEKIYVGWNLKDTTYGFPLLKRRYRELFGKEPPEIRQIVDLDEVIKEKRERSYVNHGAHGKLYGLMVLNGLSLQGFRSGKEEIELHERTNFREIEVSTNCKVSGIANILDLFINSKLKTQIGAPEETSESQAFSIGAISNLFGMRMGTYTARRLFDTMGIKDIQGKNKSEQIKYVLTEYVNNPNRLVQILNILIQHHKLTEDHYDELDRSMRALGLKIENRKVITSAPAEMVYEEHRPFTVFKDIERIMLSAKSQLSIIDPYVDKILFSLYFADVSPNVSIRLLTKKMFDKFEEAAKKFKIQKSNFEVRISNEIHDRFILADNRVWVIGQSIKDAGGKPLVIIELADSTNALALFEKLWNKSKIVI